MRTIIGVCLDESGSMGEGGKRAAAISAFNEFLLDQQKLTVDECLLSVAAFNHKARIMEPMQAVKAVKPLSEATYMPNGTTALLDAVAYTVKEIDRGIKDDDRVVCVILTDGEENASRETTLEQVKALIAAKEATSRWNFVYLSASPDAFADGARLGMRHGNVAQYSNTAGGTRSAVMGMSVNVGDYRSKGATMKSDFGAGIGTKHAGTAAPPPDEPKPEPTPPPEPPPDDMWGRP